MEELQDVDSSVEIQEDAKEERKWCVYCHTSPSGKKYIGITGEKNPIDRWGLNGNGYLRRKPNGEFQQPAIANAILKYSNWDEWEHEIILDSLSKDEAEQKEIELIKKYNTRNSKYGYNINPGGSVVVGKDHPFYGKHHTEETKEKLSKMHMGKRCGELNPNYGKSPKEWMSEESYIKWKQEIGEASLKNWQNEEFRQKRHDAMKKYWDEHPEKKEQLRLSQLGEKSLFYGKSAQELMGFDEEKIKRWKEKLSDASRGEKHYLYGKHLPEEVRQKISSSRIERGVAKGEKNPRYGKHCSEETKSRISEALTGKYSGINNSNNKAVFCIDLKRIFYSAKYAQEKTGVYSKNIGACCRHYRDFYTAGGYKWCFCNDYITKEGEIIPGAITLGYITQEDLDNYLNKLKAKGTDKNGKTI